MRTAQPAWIVVTALLWGAAVAEDPARIQQEGPSVSEELTALYNEDQQDRREGAYSADELAARYQPRRARVEELLAQGGLRSASDFFYAAMICQGGNEADDYVLAAVLATAAGFRGHRLGRWLAAASLDRLFIVSGQQQFFGTQFQYDPQRGWSPGDPHPFLNPTMRRIFELESTQELQSQADQWNQQPPR